MNIPVGRRGVERAARKKAPHHAVAAMENQPQAFGRVCKGQVQQRVECLWALGDGQSLRDMPILHPCNVRTSHG